MRQFILATIFLAFTASIGQAQIIKCKAFSFTYREKISNTSVWTGWSSPIQVDILITIDDPNNRIKIYSSQEQGYDIIKAHGKTVNRNGEDVHKWECINDQGVRCYVYIINNNRGKRELSVEFSDLNWKYSINII